VLFNDFFQAGSLVFGGGHVVLPLLQNIVGDQLSQDAFLTGYAAAQAVPGPMFTFATYIGYELMPSAPIAGALIATLAVFLPGFLLLLGVLKNWQSLAKNHKVSGAVNGVNAAVVGLLVAALYQPVFTSAVINPLDISLVLVGFYLLKQHKLPIVWMVAFFMLAGLATGYIA
jgi:chromate transporter